MNKIEKFINKYIIYIVFILSIPAVRYLFVKGYFGVSDDLHIGWLFEMDRVVKMLQFPPRYVPDLSFGFGYPLFTFVYPLPFYIAEAFHLIGFSLVNSVKLVFGLSLPLSMYFMYQLLRKYVPNQLSLAGSVLYVYAPYRALELFVRGTIGEIVAFVFFPLIILSFINLTDEGSESNKNKWIGIAGLSVAGLVLSHNIMAYMFMPFLILFVVVRIIWIVKDKRKVITDTIKAILLGLSSSIYFWFPAIYESALMKYDTVFNFYDHYPSLIQFITPYWGYGASVPGPYDTMSFYMGLVGVFVFALGLIMFVVNRRKYSKNEQLFIVWPVVVSLISVFMMNFRSAYLWRNLPLLPYFQFPWRFLAMTTLMSPLLLVAFNKIKSSRLISLISLAVVLSAIGFNFNYFKTSEYLGRMDGYYINRYIPVPEASSEYLKTSEEYLRLLKSNEVRPTKLYPRAYTDDLKVVLETEELNSLNAKIKTNSENEFLLNYSKYNYPGWVVKIDGNITKIIEGKPYGQISFMVPSGEHYVVVEYKESPFRLIFDIVSLVSITMSAYLIFKKK